MTLICVISDVTAALAIICWSSLEFNLMVTGIINQKDGEEIDLV